MKKEARFGHNEGITDITFAPDGSKIITCGTDGDVRIWEGMSDDDPISFSASDSCFSLFVTKDNEVIVGTENNAVEAYEYPKGKFVDNKLKFTGAANHLDISGDGKYLLAGSADMTIQLTLMKDSTVPPVKVNAHTAPVLSVAIDPMKEFIVSSGCDGSVCIWSFENPKKLVKKWSHVFPSSNDITTSPTLCRMAWHPLKGTQLAVPQKDKVVIYKRESWAEIKSLTCSKLTKLFSIVRFSGCGTYIGVGGSDGTIAIWDSFSYKIQVEIKEAHPITGLTFNPKIDQVLCTDYSGRLVSIQEFTVSSSSSEDHQTNGELESNGTTKPNSDEIQDTFDYDLFDDDDGENTFSMSKIKAESGYVDGVYVGKTKSAVTVTNGGIMDEDNDDTQSVASSKVSRPVAPLAHVNPFTKPQESFQPSSTPESLEHRFMAWNNIGIIRSYSNEDEEYTDYAIDIEFHDESVHMPIHLQNNSDYTIGNMSSKVVVLSSGESADANSKLFCLTFDIWDTSKEWTIDLPKGENVTGIALGSGWIAVGTSERRIRLFSIGGIQKFVYDFGGDLVALSGYENLLFLTYHNGVGINGNQNISYSILKVSSNSSKLSPLILDAALTLSRASTLSWMGFTDEGTPAFSDSKNMLRLLNGRMWTPFCNMRDYLSGSKDHFWVVGVSEISLEVRAVKCKGVKYPATVPKPIIMMLDAKLPLCEMDKEKSKLEDLMLQSVLLSNIAKKKERSGFDMEEHMEKAATNIKKHLMKLFTLSCDANRDFRAFEYVTMMPSSNAIQLATKYSSRVNRLVLTGHLHEVGRRKLEEENEAVEDENDDFESSVVVTHVDHRYLTSSSNVEALEDVGNSSISSPAISGLNRSGSVNVPIIIDDNPLLKKQKEEIRSILSPVGFRKNPFKKDKKDPSSTLNTALSRNSSFTSSLVNEEDSESQPGMDVSGNEDVPCSKGVSKIDVWKKPMEKLNVLPEFNPKNPNRKSRTSNKAGGGGINAGGTGGGKKNPFEKKRPDTEGKEVSKGKKQQTLFDMQGRKSSNSGQVGNGKRASESFTNSNPNSPMTLNQVSGDSNDENNSNNGESENLNGEFYEDEEFADSERVFKQITDKKRKRHEDLDVDDGKKTKINGDEIDM